MKSGLGRRVGLWMAFAVVLLSGSVALAQDARQSPPQTVVPRLEPVSEAKPVAAESAEPAKPVAAEPAKPAKSAKLAEAPSAHRFWDRENVLLFAGVGASRALDYNSTRNMQSRGREEILLPDDVVNNTAAFVAVEAGGALASVGISYLLHRTHHHKMERWLSIGHIGVSTFGAVRNYSLETKR